MISNNPTEDIINSPERFVATDPMLSERMGVMLNPVAFKLFFAATGAYKGQPTDVVDRLNEFMPNRFEFSHRLQISRPKADDGSEFEDSIDITFGDYQISIGPDEATCTALNVFDDKGNPRVYPVNEKTMNTPHVGSTLRNAYAHINRGRVVDPRTEVVFEGETARKVYPRTTLGYLGLMSRKASERLSSKP